MAGPGTTQDSPEAGLRLDRASGRWALLATVLGSGVASLDATVVNIALPTIGTALDARLAGLQWVINGYTLPLAALILLGGSLGDRFGRRRIFMLGTVWFAAASLLCALSPTIETLIAARALQGIGGALLTPGSLSIIQASFAREHRARAIGAWSGLIGVTSAVGPFLGGGLIALGSWRLIFLLNLPLAVAVIVITLRHVPESKNPPACRHLDLAGVVLGAAGLAGISYAATVGGDRGLGSTLLLIGGLGLAALLGFLVVEHRSPQPMLPLGIFASRQFSAVNTVTLAMYAALSGVFFLLVLHLQVVAGFSALLAGIALLPVTLIMLVLSARVGALAQRVGPRWLMTAGPLVAAAGLLMMLRIGQQAGYLTDVLPAVALFGLGLALTVAPLTATALAAAPAEHSGLASGVNNAIARTAGLLAVAVLPAATGLGGNDYTRPEVFTSGFRLAMLICAGLLVLAAALAAASISNTVLEEPSGAPSSAQQGKPPEARPCSHCGVEAPPLQSQPESR